jgi:hypothetical protein
MKHEAARYVSECDTCRKVNYMKSGGLLQLLSIPDWKWDDISMDLIVGLPVMTRKFDSILVIVDRLSKFAHFILVNTKYRVEKYAEIYIARVLCFWEQLHMSLETHLIHSLAYHPQTDGQKERVNQVLEDMLRACVMEYQGSWDKNLPWAEFSYNNNYQESLKMAPFEVVYGRRCRTPLNWIEPGEKVIFRPDIIEEAKMIVIVSKKI